MELVLAFAGAFILGWLCGLDSSSERSGASGGYQPTRKPDESARPPDIETVVQERDDD